MTKETLKETVVPIAIVVAVLLIGLLLSTGSTLGFLLLPVVTYSAGAVLGRLKNDKWNWKDGLMWGVIGVAASFLFSLAV